MALAIYVWIQTWGPHLQDPRGLEVQVIAQKVITIAAIAILLYETFQAEKARTTEYYSQAAVSTPRARRGR